MWQLYFFSFVAGLFGANGVPHFIKGSFGEKHDTPFGKSSSAITNVIWGWANFAAAFLVLFVADVHSHLLRAFMMVALGALVMSLFNANNWMKTNKK